MNHNHLYRSRDDRMLAGVAGGLAELWDADPSLVRIIWALLVVLTGGVALVVYIVMAIVVPEEEDVRPWGAAPGYEPPAAPLGATGQADSAAATPTGSPTVPGPGAAAPAGPTGQPDWAQARFDARAARREARAARRAARRGDGRSGGLIIGTLLVLVGAWFLVRQYLPTVDWDWFWPLTLVVAGVLVLVLAIRPSGGSSGDRVP